MYYGAGNYTPVVPQGFEAFGRWFDWAVKRFGEKWQVWLFQGLIVMVLMAVWMIAYLVYIFRIALRSGPTSTSQAVEFFAVFSILMLLLFVVQSFLLGGMLNTATKQAHGEEITVLDMFSGGSTLLLIMGASLVVFIPYIIGIYLCVIPGLVWIAFTWLTIPLIVTRRMGVFEAISTSMAIARQNFWLVALYGLVSSMLAGMLLFLAMPAMALLHTAVIADIYGISNPYQMPPPMPGSIPPPPTSYGPPPAPPQNPPSSPTV